MLSPKNDYLINWLVDTNFNDNLSSPRALGLCGGHFSLFLDNY